MTFSTNFFRNPISKLALLAAVSVSTSAWAQVEPIGPVTVLPGAPVVGVFTNFIPPQPAYKELQFTGTGLVPAGAIGTLQIDFDYVDTTGMNVVVPAPNSPFVIPGGGFVPIDTGILLLPFCPQVVSLHLTNIPNAAAVPIEVRGFFRHQCFPVPEPTSLGSLGGLGLLGMAVQRRLRKRLHG